MQSVIPVQPMGIWRGVDGCLSKTCQTLDFTNKHPTFLALSDAQSAAGDLPSGGPRGDKYVPHSNTVTYKIYHFILPKIYHFYKKKNKTKIDYVVL